MSKYRLQYGEVKRYSKLFKMKLRLQNNFETLIETGPPRELFSKRYIRLECVYTKIMSILQVVHRF